MKEEYMRQAIACARKAAAQDEVPVGAVIVKGGEVIAAAHNEKESRNCALYHAEMLAVQRATEKVGNWYLEGCSIYVTLEPCPMCVGAIINSRLDAVYYGASDPKAGCCGSVFDLISEGKFNHKPIVEGGILAKECGALLTEFFRAKRAIINKI